MSERSFRRENERRIATAERRESLRARKAAAAAAVVGAFALASPAASSAANFVVNTTDTGGTTCDPNDSTVPCALPDAVDQANATNEDDVITFSSALSGSTIDLSTGTNTGPLVVQSNYGLTINGLGAANLTVSAGGASYVFDVEDTGTYRGYPGLNVSGLTITDGSGTYGGAIHTVPGTYFHLDNSVVSGSTASGDFESDGPFLLRAGAGGGIFNAGTANITNTLVTGNQSPNDGPYGGGGVDNLGAMSISDSTVTGNYSASIGGGVMNGVSKYPTKLDISNSTITGNYAAYGGAGVGQFDGLGSNKYGISQNRISDTTISDNHTTGDGDGRGGGIGMKYIGGSDNWTITHSTIGDGNTADYGGGIGLSAVAGHFTLIDSTVSGNGSSYVGGGVSLLGNAQKYPDTVQFQNSTIASNQTGFVGGGIYLNENLQTYSDGANKYPAHITVGSTIVADNTADGDPSDIDQGDVPLRKDPGAQPQDATPGFGFDLAFDLVEAVGPNAEVTELPPGSNIFGVDPQLGGLADNGGPTLTHLPATTSPVIDKGNAPSGLTTDQRGEPRTVDTDPANANDGTDIGSVELPSGTGPPTPPPAGGNLGTKVHNVKKKHKKRRRIIRTFHKSAKIHLTFSSPIAGATFTCSVDGGAFEPCKSPFSVRLKSAPGHGASHSITIVTRDQAGNQLGKPKTFKFRIIQKT
jgi:hypothetical protein